MRFLMTALALCLLFAKPLTAQQATQAPASRPSSPLSPGISQWQSYQPKPSAEKQLRAAVAGDRDLTSEKIAIVVLAAILIVVIIRSVK